MSEAYRIEAEKPGCEHCGAGSQWCIVGPDEIALSTSWEDKSFAEDLCEELNLAHEKALADCHALHPASSWTEAEGPVLWWHEGRPDPYVGTGPKLPSEYFTHWSRIPKVEQPKEGI